MEPKRKENQANLTKRRRMEDHPEKSQGLPWIVEPVETEIERIKE
jgi:hypothetical protein